MLNSSLALSAVAAGAGGFLALGPRLQRRRASRAALHARYKPPVDWTWFFYPWGRCSGRQGNPLAVNLVSSSLLAQRAAMPPFVLHYRPHDLDKNGPGLDCWLSKRDGNPALSFPWFPVMHYIQTVEVSGLRARLRLWHVSPDIVGLLNSGPRRHITVCLAPYPSGRMRTFCLPVGLPPGTSWPWAFPSVDVPDMDWYSDDERLQQASSPRSRPGAGD